MALTMLRPEDVFWKRKRRAETCVDELMTAGFFFFSPALICLCVFFFFLEKDGLCVREADLTFTG